MQRRAPEKHPRYIAANLRQIRKEKMHMTQEKLAELAEISKDTVSNIERGIVTPQLSTLIALSYVTNTAVDYFLSPPAPQSSSPPEEEALEPE